MESHRSLRCVAFVVVALSLLCFGRAQDANEDGDDVATVHGRVVDRDGKPVAGCAVGLFDLGEQFETKALLALPRTRTNANGRYSLRAKREHYYVVAVATAGHQVCVQRLQSAPEAVCYMPDALMLPGTTLRGRVRDTEGHPIANAHVHVEDPITMEAFVSTWFESQARCDVKGIFEAHGVPRTGLRVTVSAPGFASMSRLAGHDSPLDFRMKKTGLVRGRVVDASGEPVRRVTVRIVTVEKQFRTERIKSDDEGRFAITAPNTHAFRVVAYENHPPFRRYSSRLLHGPTVDVVLSAEAGASPGSQKVTVRCRDAVSKAPIENFHASWRAIDPKVAILVLMRHPERRKPFRGEAVFDVAPDIGDDCLGTIVVDAPGYGHAIVPIPDDPQEPLIADLPAECFLVGHVVDAATGKPAVGAAVRALPHSGTSGSGPDPWKVGAITDKHGAYRIGGLAAGRYDVQVYGVGRPASRSAQVAIEDGQQGKLDLEVPKERFLEFGLVGDIPSNSLGVINLQLSYGMRMGDGMMLHAAISTPPPVPVLDARKYRSDAVGNGQYQAFLVLPTRDRVGSALSVDLGRIGDAGTSLELPDLRQVVHSGRVHLPADVPPERVAVIATRIPDAGRRRRFNITQRKPLTVCLRSDGRFVIDLSPGKYALQLADLASGLVFYTEDQDREFGIATADTIIEVKPTIHWLEMIFTPTNVGDPMICNSVGLDVQRPRGGELSAMLNSYRSSGARQEGSWRFLAATRSVRLLVPAANLKLQAHQNFQALARGSHDYIPQPSETVELDITKPLHRVTFRVAPPPSDAELEGAKGK